MTRHFLPFSLVLACACPLFAQNENPTGESAPLSQVQKLTVREFRFEGNTVFNRAQLRAVVAPFEGREISVEELEEARRALTRFYIERGYVNSGAILRDQKIENGVVVFTVIEGKLTNFKLSGRRFYRADILRNRVLPDPKAPLNALDLQNRLQILRLNPNIAALNGEIKPGARPGEATLELQVRENRPYGATLEFDNHRPPSVGAERLGLSFFHRNLSGREDEVFGRIGLTYDDLKFANPLNPRDFALGYKSDEFEPGQRLALSYSQSDTSVIEEAFLPLDISSESRNFSVAWLREIDRTLSREWNASLTLEHRASRSFLLGEPFSFSPGDRDGRAQTTALRFGTDFLQRSQQQVVAARFLLSYSNNFPGSTRNEAAPDGKFVTFLAQSQWVRAVGSKGQRVIARFDGQLASRPLLSVEKFVLGGNDSVRGFRENQLVRDSGFSTSLEFRQPLTYDRLGRERLILAPFFDFGYGKNRQTVAGEKNTLASAGLGLLYANDKHFSAGIYYGHALKNGGNSSGDLQDKGLHFTLSFTP